MKLLVHLAFIAHSQLGDHALEKIALDYMEEDEEEIADNASTVNVEQFGGVHEEDTILPDQSETADVDADLEILDAPPAIFKTPSKKKTLKVKEKQDDSFLRRSRRIANKLRDTRMKDVPRKLLPLLKSLMMISLMLPRWL